MVSPNGRLKKRWPRFVRLFRSYIYIPLLYICIAFAEMNIVKRFIKSWERQSPSSGPANLGAGREENRKLLELWELKNRSSLVFVTLDIRAHDQDQSLITELGLSQWGSDGKSDTSTYHWLVTEHEKPSHHGRPMNVAYSSNAEAIHIRGLDVTTALSGIFHNICSSYDKVCLAGYGTAEMLHRLGRYWVPPQNVIILDVGKIWQAQHESAVAMPLSECLEAVEPLDIRIILANAGDTSRALMKLVQIQGQLSGRTHADETDADE